MCCNKNDSSFVLYKRGMFLYSDSIFDQIDFMKKLMISLHQLIKLITRIQNSCMISSMKNVSDSFISIIHLCFQKIHRYLSRNHKFFFSITSKYSFSFNSKMFRNFCYNIFITSNCCFLWRFYTS